MPEEITEEVIVYVEGDTARCTGENNDHPLVFYNIPQHGFVICRYCNLKFIRKDK